MEQYKLNSLTFLITRRFSQRDAFGEPLVLTIHEEARKGNYPLLLDCRICHYECARLKAHTLKRAVDK